MIVLLRLRRIAGQSMLPGYLPDSIIAVTPLLRRPRIGEVILLRHDGKDMIKRVARLQADTMYVLGDNAAVSADSRYYGWLPLSSVIGRVWRLSARKQRPLRAPSSQAG